uniref:NADH-ubiquinone oxidoreductase chain 4L n=1 Tax=Chrysolina aeruginosa TaxID=640304 RepID=A0A7H0R0D4_9CUCU|nr:NADH dehydrogenase subunit 4L [Chrysolina aeruginosa]QNQ64883.1 NADH dehydrogenase subunit 4L [Chrysolina aeruginosa]QUB07133.1 NADH dehydrogenase subunit 4L [Chrysochus chinensis]
MEINLLIIYMFFSGLLVFCMNFKHLLIMLLGLEFVVLSIFLMIFNYLSIFNYDFFFVLIFLIMSVSEGALALGLLVSMIRSHGNDYMLSFSFLW